MNNWPTSPQNIHAVWAMATLPALATTDGVLEEMAYALDTLKLDGVATTTSTDDIYLGDARYDPWFEEMNRRGVTLFVHPVPAKGISLRRSGH